jgi:hypothetical protein
MQQYRIIQGFTVKGLIIKISFPDSTYLIGKAQAFS